MGWDLVLHRGGHPGFVPEWYTLLCAGFDPVLAVAIPLRMGGWDVGSDGTGRGRPEGRGS